MTHELTFERYKKFFEAATLLGSALKNARLKKDLENFYTTLVLAKAYCNFTSGDEGSGWRSNAIDLMKEIRDIYNTIPYGNYYLSHGIGLTIRASIEKMFKDIFDIKSANMLYSYLDYFKKPQCANVMLASIDSYIHHQSQIYMCTP